MLGKQNRPLSNNPRGNNAPFMTWVSHFGDTKVRLFCFLVKSDLSTFSLLPAALGCCNLLCKNVLPLLGAVDMYADAVADFNVSLRISLAEKECRSRRFRHFSVFFLAIYFVLHQSLFLPSCRHIPTVLCRSTLVRHF